MTGLTIIVPTYNRYGKVRPLLEYLSKEFPNTKKLVLDSSFPKIDISQNVDELTEIISFPDDVAFSIKLLRGLSKTTTPFCCICADDDFIIREGVTESLKFLDKNPDFVCAHGQYKSFFLISSTNYIYLFDRYKSGSLDANLPFDRLNQLAKFYTPNIYAVHRTDDIKIAVDYACRFFTDNFGFEIASCFLTALIGKFKRIETLFYLREREVARLINPQKNFSNLINENGADKIENKLHQCLLAGSRAFLNTKSERDDDYKIPIRSYIKSVGAKKKSQAMTIYLLIRKITLLHSFQYFRGAGDLMEEEASLHNVRKHLAQKELDTQAPDPTVSRLFLYSFALFCSVGLTCYKE